MPSTEKSNRWFVRIDGNKEHLTEKVKLIRESADTVKLLCIFHTGETKENTHIHYVVETVSVVQKQSYSQRIKNQFGITKKSDFSCKVWDGKDEACSYMFHEADYQPIAMKGFDDNDIIRFIELNQKVQKVIEINKQRAPGRCVERMIALIREEGNDNPTREEILTQFLRWIRDGEMYEPGNFQLEKYMEEVYLKTRPASEWDDYCLNRIHKILSRV